MTKKEIIAKNILALRKKSGYTQADLAEKLNYSDKAISKWERAESLPDAEMLYNIASLFGVEIGYLFEEHEDVKLPEKEENNLKRRESRARLIFALVLSSTIVTIIFICSFIILRALGLPSNYVWMIFLTPVLPSVALLFEMISGKRVLFTALLSVVMWSFVFSTLSAINFVDSKPAFDWIFVLGLVLQIAIVIYPRVLRGVRNPKTRP